MYRLRHGKYVGVKQENFSDNVTLNTTDVCFYAPDLVDDCLQAEKFLSYNRSGHEEMCYTNCQHKREDVFYDDDDRQQRIINFRMMPPDDKEDDAFVIRLYNNTVVWLMTSSCYSQPSVLSDIWKPRRYILDEDYPRPTSSISEEGTVSSCLVNLNKNAMNDVNKSA